MIKRLCFIFILSISVLYASDDNKPYKLTIIHVSDTHGHVLDFDGKSGVASPMGVLVEHIREEAIKDGGHVLFLHSGDLNTGVPESDMLKASPDIKVLNVLGLDAMALGNHEFDNPMKILKEQQKQAHFPFLVSNITYKNPKTKPFPSSVIEDIDGHKVCIFGLLTDSKTIFSTQTLKSIDVTDPYEAAKEVIKTFPKGCFIIALSHLGISFTDRDTGDFKLAKTNPEINVIFGGHTHTTLKKPIERKNTLIVHSGFYAKGVSRLDLEIGREGIEDYKYAYLTTDSIDDALAKNEDPEIKKIMAAALKKAGKYFNTEIGVNNSTLSTAGLHQKEGALGDLLTDAIMTEGKCDAAIINSGGIRSGIDAGKIHVRDIYKVFPFSDKIIRIPLTSDQLVVALKEGYFKQARKDRISFFQVAGIKIDVYDGNVVLKEIKGKAPVQGKKYFLCADDFVAGGAEGMELLKNAPNKINTNMTVRDGLVEYVKSKKVINYQTEGRVSTTGISETK